MNAVSMHAFRRRALLPFRLAFTAFAFALFGLGGIVFGFFLTPWLKMAGGTPEEKKSLARRVVKRWFGLFVSVVTSLGLVRIEVKNPEAFQKKGAILAANHPSLIDIVCLLSIVPEATTIVKHRSSRIGLREPPFWEPATSPTTPVPKHSVFWKQNFPAASRS